MALYKRKEFYEKCGVSKSYLSVYIGRKKVILTEGMIDSSIPGNAYFMQKCLDKLEQNGGESPGKPPKEKPKKPPTILTIAEVQEAKVESDKPVDPAAESAYNLQLDKKKLDIEKTQEDIKIAKLKREKMSGELIPTDLVMVIFASHFKSVTTSFQQAVENLISSVAKRNGLDRKQVAEIRGELTKIINEAIKDSIIQSEKDVSKIVEEYSQKRGRGERA